MKLIVETTRELATIGTTYNGHVLAGFRTPHKPSSSGKCWTADGREYFVGVLGLKWIEREDRGYTRSNIARIANPSILVGMPESLQYELLTRVGSERYEDTVQAIFTYDGYDVRLRRSCHDMQAFAVTYEKSS
jgi:hypothetical protein